jgi:polyisoprenoid-binding protein YceI
MLVKKILGVWFLALGACAGASFDLDPSKTEIHFTLHDVLHTVHGTFALKRGTIQWEPGTGSASGEIVVDVSSGKSGSDSRDRRMHKEILESQRYPEAVFTPDHLEGQVAPQGESQVDVHGTFQIHGTKHELVLHFQVQAGGDQNQYLASTTFSIPYVTWGMKNPSNFLLKVDDKVEMEIRAVTVSHS